MQLSAFEGNGKPQRGLTLVELTIIIAIILIIAVIAIPAFLRSKITANEASAIGTLHSLGISQVEFQEQRIVDQNGNGKGEFGVFGELTGNVSPRSSSAKIDPVFIGASLFPSGALDIITKSGYTYQIFLPGVDDPVTDNGFNPAEELDPSSDGDVITLQEVRWICYAWPLNVETTGIQAFAIAQDFNVYALKNDESKYSGTTQPINFDALFKQGEGDPQLRGKFAINEPSNAIGSEPWNAK